MKRGIIRMTDGGLVNMPQKDVWMTTGEIADMFGLPEAIVYRTIRSIYKKSELYEHETADRIPFPWKPLTPVREPCGARISAG